jgi:hypothetical protein
MYELFNSQRELSIDEALKDHNELSTVQLPISINYLTMSNDFQIFYVTYRVTDGEIGLLQ